MLQILKNMRRLNLINMSRKIYCLVFLSFANLFFAQIQFKSSAFETGIRRHLNVNETAILATTSMDTIRKIDLSGLGIRDVNDVIYLGKVRELNLSNNQLRDLSPLLSLPHLQILNVAGNNIKNISTFAFSDKRHFKLIVSDNNITDFNFLNPATFSNVVTVGDQRQNGAAPTYLMNNLFTLTQPNGQAVVKYNIWDSTNDCSPFTIDYGDGNTATNLQCDSYTNTQHYSYADAGFKTLKITRADKILESHFIAPYDFQVNIGEAYPLNLNLPPAVHLISLQNNDSSGTATIQDNEITYLPLTVGDDIIKIAYHYGDSNRAEFFYLFMTNEGALGIGNTLADDSVNIYPNPANGIVHIEIPDSEIKSLSLYDILGRLVKSEAGGGSKCQIGVHELPNAVYFLLVKTAHGSKTVKIIKD